MWNDIKKPFPVKKERNLAETNGVRNGVTIVTDKPPIYRNIHKQEKDMSNNYDQINGHIYQKGVLKPTSKLNLYLQDEEPPTPRLGDFSASKRGISRHSSLKRPMKSSSMESVASLSDLQPTRKQQAANKLKHALKSTSFRIPR